MLELQPDPYHQLRCPLAQAWYRSSSTARHGPGRFLHCSLHGRSGAPSAADLSRRRQLLPCPAPHRPSRLAPAAARALPAPAQRARSGPCPPVPARARPRALAAVAPSRPVPSRSLLSRPTRRPCAVRRHAAACAGVAVHPSRWYWGHGAGAAVVEGNEPAPGKRGAGRFRATAGPFPGKGKHERVPDTHWLRGASAEPKPVAGTNYHGAG